MADPKKVSAIAAKCQQDQKLFRFVRDVVFPRQRSAYGRALTADLEAFQARAAAPARSRLPLLWATSKRNFIYKPAVRYLRNGGKPFFAAKPRKRSRAA